MLAIYYEFRMQFVAYFSLYNPFVVPRKNKVIDVKLQGENSIQPKPKGILCFLVFLLPFPRAHWRVSHIRSSNRGKRQWKDGNRGEKSLPSSTIFNLLEKAWENESKPNVKETFLWTTGTGEGHSSGCMWVNINEFQKNQRRNVKGERDVCASSNPILVWMRKLKGLAWSHTEAQTLGGS